VGGGPREMGKWGFGPGQQVFSSSAANELDDDADDDVGIAAQCANQQLEASSRGIKCLRTVSQIYILNLLS